MKNYLTTTSAAFAQRSVWLVFGIGFVFDATIVSGQRRCDACLTLTPTVQVSSSATEFTPSTMQSVLRTSDGRLLVSHLFRGPAAIAVYDATGRFIRLFERPGRGPGEFRDMARLHAGPGNTVWAFDMRDGRLVRLDSNLRHIDTKTLERPFGATKAFALSGRAIVPDSPSPPPGSALALSVLDSTGRVSGKVELKPDTSGVIVASAADGGFWTVAGNQLQLRKYSGTGQLQRTTQMVMDHFQPWQGKADGEGMEGFDFPPRPRHLALLDTGNDLIVVLTRMTGAEWMPTPSNRMFRPSEMDLNRLYDTFIALVDARSGQTITSKRVPEHLELAAGAPDLLYSTRADNEGHVTTSFVRLLVRRP